MAKKKQKQRKAKILAAKKSAKKAAKKVVKKPTKKPTKKPVKKALKKSGKKSGKKSSKKSAKKLGKGKKRRVIVSPEARKPWRNWRRSGPFLTLVDVRAYLDGGGDGMTYCLECGERMQVLHSHLKVAHDITPDDYRAKWGIPWTWGLASQAYRAARSKLSKKVRRQHPEKFAKSDAKNLAKGSQTEKRPNAPATRRMRSALRRNVRADRAYAWRGQAYDRKALIEEMIQHVLAGGVPNELAGTTGKPSRTWYDTAFRNDGKLLRRYERLTKKKWFTGANRIQRGPEFTAVVIRTREQSASNAETAKKLGVNEMFVSRRLRSVGWVPK